MEKIFFGYDLVKRIEKNEISVDELLDIVEYSMKSGLDIIYIVGFGDVSVNCGDGDEQSLCYVE